MNSGENFNKNNNSNDLLIQNKENVDVNEESNDDEYDTKFRTTSWKMSVAIILKIQIGLGVLSLPQSFIPLGYVVGIITVIFMGAVMAYTGYNLGNFINKRHHVKTVSDIGYALFGVAGSISFDIGFFIYFIFVVAGALIAVRTAFVELIDKDVW